MLGYIEFLNEYHDQFDEDIVAFRNHMLEIFMPKANGDKKIEERINSIISTYCVAINKELRFDEDLIRDLGKLINMDYEDVMKKLDKETESFYNSFRGNIIG
jgi:hypothetical protein